VTRGNAKVLWHPGDVILRRYLTRAGRRRAGLKLLLWRAYNALAPLRRLYRRGLPYALRRIPWRLIGRRQDRSAQPRAPSATPGASQSPQPEFPWHRAPSFFTDLSLDPMEFRPRRLASAREQADNEELLQLIRRYWEEGCSGPQIELTSSEQKGVVEHLRGLGYL